MCNVMWDRHDVKLCNSFRKQGHVLCKGWKIFERGSGRVHSSIYNYTWREGWNIAKDGHKKRLSVGRYKPLKVRKIERTVTHGFHVYIQRPKNSIPHRSIQLVYFYGDEVRAASVMSCLRGGAVVVNRVLVKKFAKPKGGNR